MYSISILYWKGLLLRVNFRKPYFRLISLTLLVCFLPSSIGITSADAEIFRSFLLPSNLAIKKLTSSVSPNEIRELLLKGSARFSNQTTKPRRSELRTNPAKDYDFGVWSHKNARFLMDALQTRGKDQIGELLESDRESTVYSMLWSQYRLYIVQFLTGMIQNPKKSQRFFKDLLLRLGHLPSNQFAVHMINKGSELIENPQHSGQVVALKNFKNFRDKWFVAATMLAEAGVVGIVYQASVLNMAEWLEWLEKLRALIESIAEEERALVLWDLRNRFPDARGFVMFHGADHFQIKPGVFDVEQPFFLSWAENSYGSESVSIVKVPFERVIEVSWLGSPKPEEEIAISQGSVEVLQVLKASEFKSLTRLGNSETGIIPVSEPDEIPHLNIPNHQWVYGDNLPEWVKDAIQFSSTLSAKSELRTGEIDEGAKKLASELNLTNSIRTILIVEDDEPIREIHQDVTFRDLPAGIKIIYANDGLEALGYFVKKERIDLLITDRDMPGMNGEELVNAVRITGNRVPVIVFSSPRDLRDLTDSSNLVHIHKPNSRLLQKVVKLLIQKTATLTDVRSELRVKEIANPFEIYQIFDFYQAASLKEKIKKRLFALGNILFILVSFATFSYQWFFNPRIDFTNYQYFHITLVFMFGPAFFLYYYQNWVSEKITRVFHEQKHEYQKVEFGRKYQFKLGQFTNRKIRIHISNRTSIVISLGKQGEIRVMKEHETYMQGKKVTVYDLQKHLSLGPGETISITGKHQHSVKQKSTWKRIRIRSGPVGEFLHLRAPSRGVVEFELLRNIKWVSYSLETRKPAWFILEKSHRFLFVTAVGFVSGVVLNSVTVFLKPSSLSELFINLSGILCSALCVFFSIPKTLELASKIVAIVRRQKASDKYFRRITDEDKETAVFRTRTLEPFHVKEIPQAIRRLQTIRRIRFQHARDQDFVLLHRLARTVTTDKLMNYQIESELIEWVRNVKDLRAFASVMAGWWQAVSVSIGVGESKEIFSRSTKLRDFLLGEMKVPVSFVKKLEQLARTQFSRMEYEKVEFDSSHNRAPPFYDEQVRNRTVYGIAGENEIKRIIEHLDGINVSKLRAWIHKKLVERYPELPLKKSLIKSVVVFGSFMYGVRPDPTDLDILVVLDNMPVGFEKFKITSKIDHSIFRTDYARLTDYADVSFMTRGEFQRDRFMSTLAANSGVVLFDDRLDLVDEEMSYARASDWNRLVWGSNALTNAREMIKRTTRVAGRYQDAVPVWRGKAARRLDEANLYLAKIDPSLAISFRDMERLRLALRFYLEDSISEVQLRGMLELIHKRLETAYLEARASLLWRKLQKMDFNLNRSELRTEEMQSINGGANVSEDASFYIRHTSKRQAPLHKLRTQQIKYPWFNLLSLMAGLTILQKIVAQLQRSAQFEFLVETLQKTGKQSNLQTKFYTNPLWFLQQVLFDLIQTFFYPQYAGDKVSYGYFKVNKNIIKANIISNARSELRNSEFDASEMKPWQKDLIEKIRSIENQFQSAGTSEEKLAVIRELHKLLAPYKLSGINPREWKNEKGIVFIEFPQIDSQLSKPPVLWYALEDATGKTDVQGNVPMTKVVRLSTLGTQTEEVQEIALEKNAVARDNYSGSTFYALYPVNDSIEQNPAYQQTQRVRLMDRYPSVSNRGANSLFEAFEIYHLLPQTLRALKGEETKESESLFLLAEGIEKNRYSIQTLLAGLTYEGVIGINELLKLRRHKLLYQSYPENYFMTRILTLAFDKVFSGENVAPDFKSILTAVSDDEHILGAIVANGVGWLSPDKERISKIESFNIYGVINGFGVERERAHVLTAEAHTRWMAALGRLKVNIEQIKKMLLASEPPSIFLEFMDKARVASQKTYEMAEILYKIFGFVSEPGEEEDPEFIEGMHAFLDRIEDFKEQFNADPFMMEQCFSSVLWHLEKMVPSEYIQSYHQLIPKWVRWLSFIGEEDLKRQPGIKEESASQIRIGINFVSKMMVYFLKPWVMQVDERSLIEAINTPHSFVTRVLIVESLISYFRDNPLVIIRTREGLKMADEKLGGRFAALIDRLNANDFIDSDQVWSTVSNHLGYGPEIEESIFTKPILEQVYQGQFSAVIWNGRQFVQTPHTPKSGVEMQGIKLSQGKLTQLLRVSKKLPHEEKTFFEKEAGAIIFFIPQLDTLRAQQLKGGDDVANHPNYGFSYSLFHPYYYFDSRLLENGREEELALQLAEPLKEKRIIWSLLTDNEKSDIKMSPRAPSFSGKLELLVSRIRELIQRKADINKTSVSSYARPTNLLRTKKWDFLLEHASQGFVRPGFFGHDRSKIMERLNRWFGEDSWEIKHLVGGKLVSEKKAIQLYEDAYYEFFKSHSDELDSFLKNARDVYDTAPSNVESGLDYGIQETPARHLHDIAIRRAVRRLGREFEGENLIQVRGQDSLGFGYNPGVVPFHKPELILRPSLQSWWLPDTIEDFYQSTKVIVLKKLPKNFEDVLFLKIIPLLTKDYFNFSEIQNPFWFFDMDEFSKMPNGELAKISYADIKRLLTKIIDFFEHSKRIPEVLKHEQNIAEARYWLEGVFRNSELFPDLKFIDSHVRWLPKMHEAIQAKGTIPIFLARDALLVHEFRTYFAHLTGQSIPGFVLYQPGTLDRNSISNREVDRNLEYSIQIIERLFSEAMSQLNELGAWDPESEGFAQPDKLFPKVKEAYFLKLRELIEKDTKFNAYAEQIYNQFKKFEIKPGTSIVVVDTMATGKTALFMEFVIQYFSNQEDKNFDTNVLLGKALMPDLGIPQLADHVTMSGDAFHDLHWPFRFDHLNAESREPVFYVKTNLIKLLVLLYQSMAVYNSALHYASRYKRSELRTDSEDPQYAAWRRDPRQLVIDLRWKKAADYEKAFALLVEVVGTIFPPAELKRISWSAHSIANELILSLPVFENNITDWLLKRFTHLKASLEKKETPTQVLRTRRYEHVKSFTPKKKNVVYQFLISQLTEQNDSALETVIAELEDKFEVEMQIFSFYFGLKGQRERSIPVIAKENGFSNSRTSDLLVKAVEQVYIRAVGDISRAYQKLGKMPLENIPVELKSLRSRLKGLDLSSRSELRQSFAERIKKVGIWSLAGGLALGIIYYAGALDWYVTVKHSMPAGTLFYWPAAFLDAVTGIVIWGISDATGQYLNQGKSIRWRQTAGVALGGIIQGTATHFILNLPDHLPDLRASGISIISTDLVQGIFRTFVVLVGGAFVSLAFALITSKMRKESKVEGYESSKERGKTVDMLIFKFVFAPVKTYFVVNIFPVAIRVFSEQAWDFVTMIFSSYLMNRKNPLFTPYLMRLFPRLKSVEKQNPKSELRRTTIKSLKYLLSAPPKHSQRSLFNFLNIQSVPDSVDNIKKPVIIGILPHLGRLPDLVRAVTKTINGGNRMVVFVGTKRERRKYEAILPKHLIASRKVIVTSFTTRKSILGDEQDAKLIAFGLQGEDDWFAQNLERLLPGVDVETNLASIEQIEEILGIKGFAERERLDWRKRWFQAIAA